MYKTLTEEEQLLKKAQEINMLQSRVGSIINFIFDKKRKAILKETNMKYSNYLDNLYQVKDELSDYYDLLLQKRLDIINSKIK